MAIYSSTNPVGLIDLVVFSDQIYSSDQISSLIRTMVKCDV